MPASRSFRIICSETQIPLVEELLQAEGFRFEPEPFSGWCRRLLHEPFPLGGSLASFFGYIYIQDRASMLPPLALAPAAGSAILDMAASPGGKSGFLAQLTGSSGFVLANEPNHARLATLTSNLQAANLLQTATCSLPGQSLPLKNGTWNYILLDPPCSGWGTTARHPKAARIWRGAKIDPLIKLQRQLLRHAARLLAPGGRLLYSTCTTNPDENQAQTRFAIDELGLAPLEVPEFPGFTFSRGQTGDALVDERASASQGFYLSLLLKPGETVALEERQPVDDEKALAFLATPCCDPGLLPAGEAAIHGNRVHFLPPLARNLVPSDMAWRGFRLGKMTDCRFAPDPRLRAALPCPDSAPALCIESVVELRRLLSGASIETGLTSHCAGLWHGGLPLGICAVKKGRAVSAFRQRT